jgi:hypothetical protein
MTSWGGGACLQCNCGFRERSKEPEPDLSALLYDHNVCAADLGLECTWIARSRQESRLFVPTALKLLPSADAPHSTCRRRSAQHGRNVQHPLLEAYSRAEKLP